MFLIDAFLMKISGWLREGRERMRRFVINAELSARGFFEAFSLELRSAPLAE